MSITNLTIPPLLLVGVVAMAAFFFGRAATWVKLPSIIGFIILGVLFGPCFLGLIDEAARDSLSFITEMALGFVALSIGLELKLSSLKGGGIAAIILAECLGAFCLVFAGVYLVTGDVVLSLVFAAMAPASAPAGTVAVIHEYRAKGSLTQALYAVVGFDDGLGVIIYGFTIAVARNILLRQTGGAGESVWHLMAAPCREVLLSVLLGGGLAIVFSLFARRQKDGHHVAVLVFAFVLALTGLCTLLHLSLILTNMVAGLIIINSQPDEFTRKIKQRLPDIMPFMFILFFALAGTNLDPRELSLLGSVGVVYILTRSSGLLLGARIGATLAGAEEKIRRYLGMGILSQAGLAIGLSLILKHEFHGIGPVVTAAGGAAVREGDRIGALVLTTVTATCVFFEIIGPILTRIGLRKAGEIGQEARP